MSDTTRQDCTHHTGEVSVSLRVNVLEDTGHWLADIEIRCGCGVPFSFVGPPIGVRMDGPTVNPDRTELRIPLEPGPTALPADGGVFTFQVPRKPVES